MGAIAEGLERNGGLLEEQRTTDRRGYPKPLGTTLDAMKNPQRRNGDLPSHLSTMTKRVCGRQCVSDHNEGRSKNFLTFHSWNAILMGCRA